MNPDTNEFQPLSANLRSPLADLNKKLGQLTENEEADLQQGLTKAALRMEKKQLAHNNTLCKKGKITEKQKLDRLKAGPCFFSEGDTVKDQDDRSYKVIAIKKKKLILQPDEGTKEYRHDEELDIRGYRFAVGMARRGKLHLKPLY